MGCAHVRADALGAEIHPRTAAMEIGDNVIYNGKCYVLRGLEPMSVPDRRAELENPENGELTSVPVALLEEHRADEV